MSLLTFMFLNVIVIRIVYTSIGRFKPSLIGIYITNWHLHYHIKKQDRIKDI